MWFELTYTFLGGLGMFFFGLKNLSEALQAMAGNLIRKIISALTTNRFMAVFVGMFVTMIVQSSSVTTVTVVGFVNAGLMELTQAIGVIFGANIGTTITGWIIAIKVGKYGLLFVGIGAFPLLFAKREKVKQLGLIILAIGLLFMGLKFMGAAFKPLRSDETFLAMLQYFTADSFLSVWACIIMGMLLTFMIQSSSAMLGITIAMALAGSISYQTAVALVMGENIGTTITALLASIGANTEAKRAARAHAIFNVLGVVVLSTIFWWYIDLVDGLIPGDPDFFGEDGGKPNIAAHIAAAHTVFNVVNVIIFLPFINHIARFVIFITPSKAKKEKPELKYLYSHHSAVPALALTAAEKEVQNLATIVFRMMKRTKDYAIADKSDSKMRARIRKYEETTDNIQKEITVFLCQTQQARLAADQSAMSHALIRAADELESVADYCDRIANSKDRLTASNQKFTAEAQADLLLYFTEVMSYYEGVRKCIEGQIPIDLDKAHTDMVALKKLGNKLREKHQKRLESRKCSAIASLCYSDIMVALRKVKSHTINVAQVMSGSEDIVDYGE